MVINVINVVNVIVFNDVIMVILWIIKCIVETDAPCRCKKLVKSK
jgi:hypothetical protein